MATHDYVIDNSTGANVRADINSVLQAILTNNSSSSAPSTTAAYMFWADTTSGTLKIRNSSDNAWVELLQLDGTLTLEDGSASTPGLAFRDDLNTGIFSSAADTFEIATGGTQRFQITSNGTINFNANARIQNDGILRSADGDASRPAYNFLSDNDNGMFRATTNTIGFSTAGSERLRIDSSGRFLLNMSSSVTGGKFQVNNTFNTFFAASNDAQGCVLQLEKTRSTSPGSYTIVQDGDKLGELQFKGSNGSASVIGANIQAVVNGTPGSGNDLPTDLAFRTMPDGSGSTLERMRIDSSGKLLVGLTSGLSSQDGSIQAAGPIIAKSFINSHTSNAAVLQYSSNETTLRAYGATSGSGILAFRTGGGGDSTDTEHMRIDSSGRLLLGTTTEGNESADELTVATSNNGGITIRTGTSNNGSLFFSDATSGAAEYAGFVQYVHASDAMIFGTASTERMRIDSSGLIQMATTTSGDARLCVNPNVDGTTERGITITGRKDVFDVIAINFVHETTFSSAGSIQFASTSSVTYNTSSDYRLKQDVVTLTDSITKLKQLNPVHFKWKDMPSVETDGFLAHEVQTIIPSAITGQKDALDENGNIEPQQIDIGKLTPLLTSALQEAIAKIETLETKVAALEAA